ncbi:hypothetical protein BT96DRAFT_303571 [Gymnopus androsaceus JB14]|uniref:Uncharacterized protein n=1 Tax=Gymnopus androsaceus JB14 TaxID=1447944 RepID=A0A6A4H2E5_9AGAR|nr:hypothetical protein BT96DRAFT_303554 [Gymnopus androsaceus JB14]KAE9391546.1 hypothetical protein BT96DRAFT_303571 [Gymnopus androsaceus JB14]
MLSFGPRSRCWPGVRHDCNSKQKIQRNPFRCPLIQLASKRSPMSRISQSILCGSRAEEVVWIVGDLQEGCR